MQRNEMKGLMGKKIEKYQVIQILLVDHDNSKHFSKYSSSIPKVNSFMHQKSSKLHEETRINSKTHIFKDTWLLNRVLWNSGPDVKESIPQRSSIVQTNMSSFLKHCLFMHPLVFTITH